MLSIHEVVEFLKNDLWCKSLNLIRGFGGFLDQ